MDLPQYQNAKLWHNLNLFCRLEAFHIQHLYCRSRIPWTHLPHSIKSLHNLDFDNNFQKYYYRLSVSMDRCITISLHLNLSVGRRTEVFPALDDKCRRKQRFLEYTAVSTKRWQGTSAKFVSFEINNCSNLLSFPLELCIREHICMKFSNLI